MLPELSFSPFPDSIFQGWFHSRAASFHVVAKKPRQLQPSLSLWLTDSREDCSPLFLSDPERCVPTPRPVSVSRWWVP